MWPSGTTASRSIMLSPTTCPSAASCIAPPSSAIGRSSSKCAAQCETRHQDRKTDDAEDQWRALLRNESHRNDYREHACDCDIRQIGIGPHSNLQPRGVVLLVAGAQPKLRQRNRDINEDRDSTVRIDYEREYGIRR